MVSMTTQSITPGITKMIYSADGKTEWNGSIPVWCPLPTGKAGERDKVLDGLEQWCKEQDKVLISDHRIPLWEIEQWITEHRQDQQNGEGK
jgi:hypothetical protein